MSDFSSVGRAVWEDFPLHSVQNVFYASNEPAEVAALTINGCLFDIKAHFPYSFTGKKALNAV